MGLYDKYILPPCLDKACSLSSITRQRQKVVPNARGLVLEIGIGSGLNLPHYDPAKVTEIIGVDPDAKLWARSQARRAACSIPAERTGLNGEAIDRDSESVDTVVVTYALCTIADPVKALCEMQRVLRPSGQILFTEHGLAPDANVAKWQSRIDPLWKKLAGGCHTGRDIPALFTRAGLELDTLEQMYIPGPKVLAYNYWGATRPK